MSSAEAMIAHLKLMIAKYKRDQFGQSSERARHLDQLEFQLEELEATATEDALAAEVAAAKVASIPVKGFERKKPIRAPLPAHLPRERVVIP
ncbi:MAG TPA: transposase, partial [Stellaceae bacterium]|nr:transposase [Stellaceae bacterium]